MEDKRIFLKRKRLNLQLVPIKKKHLNLQSEMRTMTEFCYLNTYNPLSENFNNITMWSNLTHVELSNSKIIALPRAFGKLRLNNLNLSQNYFGTFNSTKWPWMEQNDIKNTLHFLDISDNSLTILPLHIEKLNALRILNARKNLLTCLPQSIGNMQNLRMLNVSYNKLQYLPAIIIFANLYWINITKNPFQTLEHKYNVPSLAKLSANIVLQHRILYDTGLSPIYVKFLKEVECCFLCRRFGVGFLCLYILLPCYMPTYSVFCSAGVNTIQFQIYCCLSSCENNLRYAEYNRNMNTLIYYIRELLFVRRRIYLASKEISAL